MHKNEWNKHKQLYYEVEARCEQIACIQANLGDQN